MENSTTNRKKNKGKTKFQSVNIIRDNQPLKFRQITSNNDEDDALNHDDDVIWEDGCIPSSSISNNNNNINVDNVAQNKGVTIEFDTLPDLSKKKRIRRATAEDKVKIILPFRIKWYFWFCFWVVWSDVSENFQEFAEIVHKAHLLCLIARGRLVDAACDDPLIQVSVVCF